MIIDGYSSLLVSFPTWVRQDHHCYVLFCLLTVLYTHYYSALNFLKAFFHVNLPDYQSHELISIS